MTDKTIKTLEEIIYTFTSTHDEIKELTMNDDIKVDEVFIKFKTENLPEIINSLYDIQRNMQGSDEE